MLGLILIYFIGKSFYNLAGEHNRSEWGFAILGVVTYYAAMFLSQMAIAFIMVANGSYIEDINEVLLAFLGIPFGLLAWWGVYSLLKKQWSKNPIYSDAEILDDTLIDELD